MKTAGGWLIGGGISLLVVHPLMPGLMVALIGAGVSLLLVKE